MNPPRSRVLLLLLLVALPVRADPRRTKIAGMTLTIAGSVLTSSGAVLLGLSTPSDSPTASPNLLLPGLALGSAGVLTLAVGIPLWVIGAHRERHARRAAWLPDPRASPTFAAQSP